MRRRSFLATVPVALAGCVGASGTDTAEPAANASTTPSTPGSTAPTGISTPTEPCEPVDLPSGPVDYPDLPESVTEAAATAFATDFETAYGAGEIEADGDDYEGFDGGDATVRERTGEGLLLRAWVSLDYTTENAAGSARSEAWYYVTGEFAVRAPAPDSTEEESVPDRGWETVACAPRD